MSNRCPKCNGLMIDITSPRFTGCEWVCQSCDVEGLGILRKYKSRLKAFNEMAGETIGEMSEILFKGDGK